MENTYQPKILPKNFQVIAWQIFGVIVFIICDAGKVLINGTSATIGIFTIFYAFDISYFFLVTWIFLPWVLRFSVSKGIRICIAIFIIPVYAMVLFIVNEILESWINGKFSIRLTIDDSLSSITRSSYIFTLALSYWYARFYREKADRLVEVEQLKRESMSRENNLEIAFLRSQVNPHLLYNSLNALYLRIHEVAPRESESIFQLAEIMAYAMVSEKESDMSTLKREAENMENVISLHKLIHNDELEISFIADQATDHLEVNIPSMLFVDFITNIFKYGDLKDSSRPALVRFGYADQQIYFMSSNKVNRSVRKQGKNSGHDNITKRLDKYFPGKHSINFGIQDNEYFVEVRIMI